MYCAHCGKELDQNAKFCNKCGKQLKETTIQSDSTEEVNINSEKKPNTWITALGIILFLAGIVVLLFDAKAGYKTQPTVGEQVGVFLGTFIGAAIIPVVGGLIAYWETKHSNRSYPFLRFSVVFLVLAFIFCLALARV